MGQDNLRTWQFNRQINVSACVQIAFLAALIIGSWVNLQSQLDLLQHDVASLLDCQKRFEQKLETLSEKCISYEYHLRAIEKSTSEANTTDEAF
jgi:hypothetical protein